MNNQNLSYSNNLQELKFKVNSLHGKTLADIFAICNLSIPNKLTKAKGTIGTCIESFLGASGSSKAIVDFPDLGIELKTIPINSSYQPSEATYVCTAPLENIASHWQESWVYKKLKHVLFVPILDASNIGARKILKPFFWQASQEEANILQQDWEELIEIILYDIESLSASFGTYLHIRPKAANNKVSSIALNRDSSNSSIVPRGFYLRQSFTKLLLKRYAFNDKIC